MAKEKKRFEYKLSLGKHPISGEVIRRSFYSTKSLRDAKKKAEAFQRDYEMEMMVEGSVLSAMKNFLLGRAHVSSLIRSPMSKQILTPARTWHRWKLTLFHTLEKCESAISSPCTFNDILTKPPQSMRRKR